MKKLLKLFICALTLVAGIGMAVANPAINVVNAIETISAIAVTNSKGSFGFTVKGMPTEVDGQDDSNKENFFIPFPSVSDDTATVKVNVKNGKVTHSYTIGEADTSKFVKKADNSGVYFKYTANTTYNVYFTAEKDGKTYSTSVYEVKVKGTRYSFDSASVTSLPTYAGENDKFYIPTMKVVDSEGNEVTDAGTTVKVIKNNAELAITAGSDLSKEGENLCLTTSSVGTYTVRYNSEKYNLSKDIDITVDEKFDSSKVKFSAKTLTMSQVELGKTATFPKPVVTDTYNNKSDIPVNVVISILDKEGNTVKKLDANTYEYEFTKAGSYVVKYEISNYYLNNQKTETIQIAEDVVVADTLAPVVSFAEDYSSLDKTADGWEDDVKTLGDWAVPTKVGYNGITLPALYATDLGTAYSNLTFQRVLVANNGDEYDIDDKEDNASLATDYVKDVTKPVKFTFVQKENESETEYRARIKGTYSVVYRAVETVGANETKRTGSKTVTLQILDIDAPTYNDETHLSISLPSITTEMKSSDKKTVTVTNAIDDVDKAIETHYYYYYGEKSKFDSAVETHKGEATYATDYNTFFRSFNSSFKMYELTVENKKLGIELQEFNSQPKFTVVAVAINDQGHFVYDAKEVKIKNTTTDLTAPQASLVAGEGFNAEYKLGIDTKITLPGVEFTDDQDENLSISAQYYVGTPDKMYAVNGLALIHDSANKKVTVSGAYINPSQAGVYYVVYTAKDDSNNTYEFVTSFEVTKETNYSLKLEYDKSLDIYDSTEINATIVDDEGNTVDGDVQIIFSNLAPKCEGTTYTFDYAGDYSFVAKATVNGKTIESAKCTIKVNDVAFKWDDENNITVPTTSELSPSKEYEALTSQPEDWETNYENYYKQSTGGYAKLTSAETFVAGNFFKKNELVYVQLTVPTASQNGHAQVADVKVTNPSGDEVELLPVIVEGVDTGDVKFLAEKDGKYTIVYSVGAGDNKITKTLYTTVGDNNKPVVEIANKSKLQQEIVYTEDITYTLDYTIDAEKSNAQQNVYKVTVVAKTAKETIYSYETSLALYDIDRLGNKVALFWANAIKNDSITLNDKNSNNSSSYVWTISSVGDYTLTIKATDSNGNVSNAETIKFTVTDKSSATEKKDNKVGIILIVVSLVVLAGLVCFFAFGGKAKNSVPKSLKPKKEEKQEEDKTQE